VLLSSASNEKERIRVTLHCVRSYIEPFWFGSSRNVTGKESWLVAGASLPTRRRADGGGDGSKRRRRRRQGVGSRVARSTTKKASKQAAGLEKKTQLKGLNCNTSRRGGERRSKKKIRAFFFFFFRKLIGSPSAARQGRSGRARLSPFDLYNQGGAPAWQGGEGARRCAAPRFLSAAAHRHLPPPAAAAVGRRRRALPARGAHSRGSLTLSLSILPDYCCLPTLRLDRRERHAEGAGLEVERAVDLAGRREVLDKALRGVVV
jgi:hypothetical protein